ncbi:MAG: TauD/TfdA dioxygenase family protein [Burkholderiales bacterium]
MTPQCGAEVRGLDLSRPLPEAAVTELTQALGENCVLFFRDQKLTPDQQKDLGRRFGRLHLHPAYPDILEGHPEIMVIRADENSKRIAGEDWHSDVSCDMEPPLGSILYMLDVPPVGGDTLFASMYAAFEALSAPMRSFLAGLTALHDGESTYRGRYEGMKPTDKPYPSAVHPVVRTHPVSGRQALFVNRIFTRRIVELSPRESESLLAMLFQHVETPEFQCRFHWAPGSIAFWDNRCAQHHALWDYYPHRRRGLRVTIQGDRPFYRS